MPWRRSPFASSVLRDNARSHDERGGRVNPTLISTLLGQARGTLALDRYSAGATLQALKLAVTDLQELGIPSDVTAALVETQNRRPRWSGSSRPHPGYLP